MRIVRCVLSGSFRRDIVGLERAYRELVANGCQVLSPHRLDFIDPHALFVKDKAEAQLNASEIERHHLVAIKQSDFLWVHCPGGRIGVSAAMEIGYATALGIPVFSKDQPQETVLQQLVTVMPSVFMATEQLRSGADAES